MKRYHQYTLTGLLLSFALSVVAAPVKFTTSKPKGENLSIALNSGIKVSVKWDNGESDSFVSDGSLKSILVKGTTAEIDVDQEITSLYIGNNDITSLTFDITASSIRQLYCPGNQLTILDLTPCQQLTDLNCQDNQLKNIILSSTVLEECNLSNNQLQQLSLPNGGEYVKTLSLSDNQFKNLEGVQQMKELETIFLANNQLTSISLKSNKHLRNVVAYNNAITHFQTMGLKNLRDIWISHNNLEQLDVTAANQLVSIKADHNSLSSIEWTKDSLKTFSFIDVTDNSLFFNSLPTIYDSEKKEFTVEAHILPQNEYFMTDKIIENKCYNQWKDEFTVNGWNHPTGLQTTFTNNGEVIPETLYTLQNGELTFKKVQNNVKISAESAEYPGVTLSTTPFEVTAMTFGKVVFNYQFEGKTIATESKEYEMGTLIDALPQKHEKDFCVYEFDKKVVSNVNDTVNVNVIWKGPFKFSESFETATWYYLTINAQDKQVGYLHHRDNLPIQLTTTAGNKDYYWAFLGDPFHIKVVNLSQGKDKYLSNTPNYPQMHSEVCPWTIFAANATKGKFLLHDDERGYTYYNNKTIAYSLKSTQGAHFIVKKAPEFISDYTEKIAQEITPFFDAQHLGHYFELTEQAYETYKDEVKAAEKECDETTYQRLKDMLYQNLIMPQEGYYRLKNLKTNNYLHATNKNALHCNGKGNSAETVVEMRRELPPGTYYKEKKPFFLLQNKWLSKTYTNFPPYLLDAKANFTQFLPIAPGKFAFAIAHYNARPGWEEYLASSYYTADADDKIAFSKNIPTAKDTASLWSIEEATTTEIPLKAIGDQCYGTFCVPYPSTVENGTANTVTLENDKGELHSITDTIPAMTPVLVVSPQDIARVNIHYAKVSPLPTDNLLQGTLLPASPVMGQLFIGDKESMPGFFPMESEMTAANSAFIPQGVAPAEGFFLNMTTTGISDIEITNATVFYDLQGRVVKKPKKGVYIVNHQKVYIK